MEAVFKHRLQYDLQRFAKDGNGGEKTEDATAKKLKDARNEGQVAKSNDLVMAVSLVGLFLTLKVFIGYLGNGFMSSFLGTYRRISDTVENGFDLNQAQVLLNDGIKEVLLIAAPLYLIGLLIVFVVSVVQVKWNPTIKPLKPKFNKFNPITGMKRIFSMDKVMELLKSVAKILILTFVVIDALKDQWGLLLEIYNIPFWRAVSLVGTTVIDVGVKISVFFLAIAFVDLFYQKRKFKNEMKMTKQEVRDEYKNSEGNPEIKGKIRQKMREVSQRRMMQSLPEADVVITNPTHLAVAVKYDKDAADAPLVIAKGADYLAEKIKGIAKENHVEIVENKPLARMLYYNVELGQEIPPELYQMVAEVLAYVYGVKGKL